MDVFLNAYGKPVLLKMVAAIRDSKERLSEIDGLIGDGDHGMNMNKGFSLFSKRLESREPTFTDGLRQLGELLFTEIGGSMGPIYGTLFTGMADAAGGAAQIDAATLAAMLEAGLAELYDIVEARVGDKTLVDTVAPATAALRAAAGESKPLKDALADMAEAARHGRDSTVDMVARYGRSSRLGERSRGVPDAGATSCCLLLTAMAEGMAEQMNRA